MTPKFSHVSHDEFLEAIASLSCQLAADVWKPDLLVGVGRGGLVPAVFMSHATGLPMVSIDFSTPIPEFNAALIQTLARRTRSGERLLFIEDINDSGRTIAALRAQMAAADGIADNGRFAVLMDNIVSSARTDYRFRTLDRTTTKDWFVFPWEAVAPPVTLVADANAVPERTQ